METIEEQLRKHFEDLFQDNNWHVTSVEQCHKEEYTRYQIYGAYTVEVTALRDVNGYNKQGEYNKASKGDTIYYDLLVRNDGKVLPILFGLKPVHPKPPSALVVYADSPHSAVGWRTICK